MREVPSGTVGGRTACTEMPSARRRSAIASARPGVPATATGAKNTERVRFVDDEGRAVRVAEGAVPGEIGPVGVHAEVALDDDPSASPRGALAEGTLDRLDVEVRDDGDAGARQAG